MSPRRPHLRNRKKIKTPKRSEYEDIIASPARQESHGQSEESSELEEEIYESPKPKKPKAKRAAYRGEVTEFNPNLPPAAFPTLDNSDYVHNGGTVAIDLDSHLSGLHSRKSDSSCDRDCHAEGSDLTKDSSIIISTTKDIKRRSSQGIIQASIAVQKRPQSSILSSMYGEPTSNGPHNPILTSNMARMAAVGKMSDLDRIMLEMESSDTEDAAATFAGTTKVSEVSAWDDLTVAHKLDLADAMAELYPDTAEVMHQLRLGVTHKEELVELLVQRQDRAAREEVNQQRLLGQTKGVLLQGTHLSQSAFHQMVEENLYRDINENDHLQTNLMELKKARAYLRYCGFDPRLADSNWDVPSISNAENGTKARPAQTKPKPTLASIAAQTPSISSEGPFSQRPAPFAPSQEASHPPDYHDELVQQYKLAQYRPTHAHALIEQHSPAETLLKVPIQSCRVAAGNQGRDQHTRNQGTIRVRQQSLSALQVQPDSSIDVDRRAINSAFPQPSGASSFPSDPQEEHSLLSGPHSLAPKSLPTARKNDQVQSSAKANPGPSSPRRHSIIEVRDSVNKKKSKQGTA